MKQSQSAFEKKSLRILHPTHPQCFSFLTEKNNPAEQLNKPISERIIVINKITPFFLPFLPLSNIPVTMTFQNPPSHFPQPLNNRKSRPLVSKGFSS